MAYLEGKENVELIKHDLGKEAPPVATIRRWLEKLSLAAIISSKSSSYKELNLENKVLSQNEAIALFQRDRNLLRRPIAEVGDEVIVGFSPAEYDQVLDRA